MSYTVSDAIANAVTDAFTDDAEMTDSKFRLA